MLLWGGPTENADLLERRRNCLAVDERQCHKNREWHSGHVAVHLALEEVAMGVQVGADLTILHCAVWCHHCLVKCTHPTDWRHTWM